MRNLSNSGLKALLTIVTVVCMPLSLLAQPGFDPGITDGAPIDGGLSMLAVAGVVYGVNKMNKRRKDKASEQKETRQTEK